MNRWSRKTLTDSKKKKPSPKPRTPGCTGGIHMAGQSPVAAPLSLNLRTEIIDENMNRWYIDTFQTPNPEPRNHLFMLLKIISGRCIFLKIHLCFFSTGCTRGVHMSGESPVAAPLPGIPPHRHGWSAPIPQKDFLRHSLKLSHSESHSFKNAVLTCRPVKVTLEGGKGGGLSNKTFNLHHYFIILEPTPSPSHTRWNCCRSSTFLNSCWARWMVHPTP